MIGPRCTTVALDTEERHEISIDRCPTCGGVWLDCGELEKIVAFMRQFQPVAKGGDPAADDRDGETNGRSVPGRVWDGVTEVLSWIDL
jgi:Zn-finger nucleic acid-binding protein